MKRMNFCRIFAGLAVAVMALGGLTACEDSDSWNPAPPAGWNTFYDRRLNGSWELAQANGRPVYGEAVNYMTFYGNGQGRYFYYNRGMRDSERMVYWCQYSNSGISSYQMNIQYEYSSPSTVNYWFTDGQSYLWMQWGTGSGVVTYVYRAVDGPGW